MADKLNSLEAQPVVLVTGCGSGIGFELASALYRCHGLRAVVTARPHRLPTLKASFTESGRFKIRALDVTREEQIYSLIHEICRDWGRIDVIVNNAAVCFRGVVEHMDSEAEQVQLQTNYLGPMALIRAVLPIMREQRSGQIINVSSASGMLAMPTMGSYSASKHALEGATEALWYEARPFGIAVNLLELGFVHSDAFRRVVLSHKARMSLDLAGPHSEYYRSMSPFIERLMSLSMTSPEKIARRILKLIEKRPSRLRVSGTPDVIFFDWLKRGLPSFIFNRILFRILPGSVRWGGHWRRKRASSFAVSISAFIERFS